MANPAHTSKEKMRTSRDGPKPCICALVKNAVEAKGEHWPQVVTPSDGNKSALQERSELQRRCPPAIHMNAGKKEAARQ